MASMDNVLNLEHEDLLGMTVYTWITVLRRQTEVLWGLLAS